MSTRKERRALAFGHMSPSLQNYQWDGKVNFGIQAEIDLEATHYRNELREDTRCLNIDRRFGMDDEDYNRYRQQLDLRTIRLSLWDLTH